MRQRPLAATESTAVGRERVRQVARSMLCPPRTNGFVERFQQTVLNEFFVTALRTTDYETVDALQTDLDRWLLFDNTERPHQGYRNRGRRPIDTINLFVEPVAKEG